MSSHSAHLSMTETSCQQLPAISPSNWLLSLPELLFLNYYFLSSATKELPSYSSVIFDSD
ncbi:hypothetical protein CY34DRAFT_19922 [Suillus luteus UH-Slu-Lm8-n1]|uniref:Uncharacterized protein n=1 Tax=Suillus luteus UH-Slu-Lm8-n1 TaxID=930992 RepID=A0A0C9ZZU3_9AGAM|nr:hypothetical protein CY34DRAFT_19922 [Suillus luteus UH-Slu-Lm8-n1]